MFVKGTEWSRESTREVNIKLPGAFPVATDPRYYLKKDKAKYRSMAQMSMAGYSNKEIAAGFCMTEVSIANILRQPWLQEYIIKQSEESGDDFREQVVAEGKAAFARAVDLAINAPSDKIKADLNKYLVDRYLGRAVQPIENITQPVESMSDDELRKAIPELLRAQSTFPEARRDSGLSASSVADPVDSFVLDGESPDTSAIE